MYGKTDLVHVSIYFQQQNVYRACVYIAYLFCSVGKGNKNKCKKSHQTIQAEKNKPALTYSIYTRNSPQYYTCVVQAVGLLKVLKTELGRNVCRHLLSSVQLMYVCYELQRQMTWKSSRLRYFWSRGPKDILKGLNLTERVLPHGRHFLMLERAQARFY